MVLKVAFSMASGLGSHSATHPQFFGNMSVQSLLDLGWRGFSEKFSETRRCSVLLG
jgi:hypothetical protein